MPELRAITEDDLPTYLDCMSNAFLNHTRDGMVENFTAEGDFDRTFAFFDADRALSTAKSFTADLTLPAGTSTTAAMVTNVAVRTTHRRQGLLTQMMEHQLRDIRERGENLAVLIASEAPIYGRFGYGWSSDHAGWRLDTDHAQFISPPTGTMEQVTKPEMLELAPPVFDGLRARFPGMFSRRPLWWEITYGDRPNPFRGGDETRRFRWMHRDDAGTIDGYVTYQTKDASDQRIATSEVHVGELVAANEEAERSIWAFLASIDLVTTVTAGDRSPADPLPLWLTDPRRARVTSVDDFLWSRVIDVPAFLSARGYAGSGSVVLGVADPLFGDLRVRLEVDDGTGKATASSDTADLTMSINALGSLSLGRWSPSALARAGQLEVASDRALAAADALFATQPAPWCNTWF